MNERPVTEDVARQFLLGRLDDSERQRIESLYLSDSRVKETILIVEDELMDEFLEGGLTPSDREGFLAQYSATPRQRRTLRVARLIKDYAVTEGHLTQPSATSAPRRRSLQWWPTSPRLSVPIALAVVIAIVICTVWLIRLTTRRKQESNQRVGIERELAELNGPSRRQETPEHILLTTLGPGAARSFERSTTVKPTADTDIVELRLLWTQPEQYPNYRAVIRRTAEGERYTINDLHIENDPDVRAILLRIPGHLLTKGTYQISLSGIATNGEPGFPEEYNFMIDR